MNDVLGTSWNDAISLVLVVGLVLALTFSLIALRRGLRRERELARTDELTGIENRRAFYELADREIKRATRYGRTFTVAFFDIDDFKSVNDRYGHEAGDAVLCLTADTARKTVRASDTVARLGGDEFAILLHETTAAASERVIHKLQVALRHSVQVNGTAMTVSLGVVTCLKTPETVDALLRSADELLYDAKRAGKNLARHRVVDSPTAQGRERERAVATSRDPGFATASSKHRGSGLLEREKRDERHGVVPATRECHEDNRRC